MLTPLTAHQAENRLFLASTRPHQIGKSVPLRRRLKYLRRAGVQIFERISKDGEIRGFIISLCLLSIFVLMFIPTSSIERSEAKFIRTSVAAMNRAMARMTVRMTGSIDADFVTMMEPHRLGTLKMAALEICFGKNEHLRAIAQKIAAEQLQEITAMRQALKYTLPVALPVSTVESTAACRTPAQS